MYQELIKPSLSDSAEKDSPEAVDIKSPGSRHEQITLKHLTTQVASKPGNVREWPVNLPRVSGTKCPHFQLFQLLMPLTPDRLICHG